jgi:hypothetical protein
VFRAQKNKSYRWKGDEFIPIYSINPFDKMMLQFITLGKMIII